MRRQIANPNTFFVILAAFMLLAVQGVTYGQMVSIDPASVESPAAGEQLTLNINITGGMNVTGYEITVTFDSTALSYVSSEKGDYLPVGLLSLISTPADSSVNLAEAAVALTGSLTADGDGTLATVTFTVVEAKDSTIGLTDVSIVDATTGAAVPGVTVQGGMVTGPAMEMPETPEMPEMPAGVEFKVTLTNLTTGAPGAGGQIFSPPIFVTHGHGFSIGASGEAASAELTTLAETGNNGPLAELAMGSDAVGSVVAFPAPPAGVVIPGGSVSTMVTASSSAGYLSLATMLVETNDGIVLANGLPLFDEDGNPRSFTMDLISYDAGTEENNELATHVPGPPFEGGERAPTEDVIAAHPGIAGTADVGAAFGWTEPTATVTVEAMVEMPPVEPEIPAEPIEFEVMLTNLTVGVPTQGGQIFSPPIFVTHGHGFSIGASGEAASAELTELAETGNNGPLAELAMGSDAVGSVVAFPAPPGGVVLPGASVSTMVSASSGMGYLSLATMLVQTNDGIVLGNSLPLFDEDGNPRSFTMDLISYDAGTEDNNELTTHVPGPPFGGMERAPTEDVIAAHPGIAGAADVGAAFGWTEPTASVTVAPVGEMLPVEPPVEPEPTVEPTHMFEMALAPGLNMISLPLMPAESYTASSFADMIDATVVIQLDTAMQQFVGFTADQEGDGFAIEGGKGYIVNVPGGGMVTFTGTAWGNTVEDAAAAPSVQLPSTAWAFVVSGNLLETEAGVSYTVVARNHRTGEVATRLVSSDYKEFNAVWADLTRKSVIEAGDKLEVTLLDEWDNIVSGPFTHKVGIEDLRNAYLSLALTVGDVHPAETILGQNFPNPFNPETWIPYQLEKSADVSLQIYDTSGGIVRTIDLGFKSQGFYMTRSTAAYWDGRNNMGEQVASGVYFYSLQTPDFSATRKMLILK